MVLPHIVIYLLIVLGQYFTFISLFYKDSISSIYFSVLIKKKYIF